MTHLTSWGVFCDEFIAEDIHENPELLNIIYEAGVTLQWKISFMITVHGCVHASEHVSMSIQGVVWVCMHVNVGVCMVVIVYVCYYITHIHHFHRIEDFRPTPENIHPICKSPNSPACYPFPWVKIQVDNKCQFALCM